MCSNTQTYNYLVLYYLFIYFFFTYGFIYIFIYLLCIYLFVGCFNIVQWSLYFKTTHGTKKMWSCIAGGLKIKVISHRKLPSGSK